MHCTCVYISNYEYLFHEEPIAVRIKDDGSAWLTFPTCSPGTVDVKVHTIRRRVHCEVNKRTHESQLTSFQIQIMQELKTLTSIYHYPEGNEVSSGTRCTVNAQIKIKGYRKWRVQRVQPGNKPLATKQLSDAILLYLLRVLRDLITVIYQLCSRIEGLVLPQLSQSAKQQNRVPKYRISVLCTAVRSCKVYKSNVHTPYYTSQHAISQVIT